MSASPRRRRAALTMSRVSVQDRRPFSVVSSQPHLAQGQPISASQTIFLVLAHTLLACVQDRRPFNVAKHRHRLVARPLSSPSAELPLCR